MRQKRMLPRFFDKIAQHVFADFEVCDYSVFHRAHDFDSRRRQIRHFLGFQADCERAARLGVNRNKARLIHDNATTFYVNENVCRSQVDADCGGENARNFLNHDFPKKRFR